MEPLVECGTAVRRGETVGLLHDFDHIDMDPWPAVAGVDGVVLAQAWASQVPRGSTSSWSAATSPPDSVPWLETKITRSGCVHENY